jgi:hypothetical protein
VENHQKAAAGTWVSTQRLDEVGGALDIEGLCWRYLQQTTTGWPSPSAPRTAHKLYRPWRHRRDSLGVAVFPIMMLLGLQHMA